MKRWKLSIQHYHAEIEYITGPSNIMADPMSRLVASNKLSKGDIIANSLAVLREVSADLLFLASTYLDADLERIGRFFKLGLRPRPF